MLHLAVLVLHIMGPNFLFLYFVTFPLQSNTVNRFVRLFQAVSLFALRYFFTGTTSYYALTLPQTKQTAKHKVQLFSNVQAVLRFYFLPFMGPKLHCFTFPSKSKTVKLSVTHGVLL